MGVPATLLSWTITASIAIAIGNASAASDGVAAAGATAADYERAELLLRIAPAQSTSLHVVPHWIDAGDEFWYRRETASGHEFVRVDASTGRSRPAFDHEALAGSLGTAANEVVNPLALPFEQFEYIEGQRAVELQSDGRTYRCQLQPMSCRAAAVIDPSVLISPSGRLGIVTHNDNVWLRDIASGTERALTNDGEPNFGYGIYTDTWQSTFVPRARDGKPLPPMESFWSPDSSRVIVTRVDQRHVATYPFVETAPLDHSFRPKLYTAHIPLIGERPANVEWFIFDIATGAKRRIEFPYDTLLAPQPDMLAVRKTSWSRDGDHLFAVVIGRHFESAYLFDIDVRTGRARIVIEERTAPRVDLNSTAYNPPNVAVVNDGDEIIWFSQRDGWGHLYLYDGKRGTLKNQITRGAWLVRDLLQVDSGSRRIYFSGVGREPGNPYYRYVYRINFDGSHLKLLSPEPGDHLLTSPWGDGGSRDNGAIAYQPVSPTGRFVVYNYSPIDRPAGAYIRATADAHLIGEFERPDLSAIYAAGYRPPEEFVVKAADGKTDLWGVLYKPLNFDATKRYPIIDAQYGSPVTAVVPRNFPQALHGPPGYGPAAALAQLGFIVMVVDARGTAFRSREFVHASFRNHHLMGLDDHVAAMRQLAAERPYVDLERAGITGLSFGGWTSLRAVLEFPDFFKAAVAGVPPGVLPAMYTDYHTTAYQGPPLYDDGSELRPTPQSKPLNYADADSAGQAVRLRAKLLIVLGELDENCLPASTLQFVDALIKADKEFDLLYMPSTTHGGTVQPYAIHRIWDFFVRHLQGIEPPTGVDSSKESAG